MATSRRLALGSDDVDLCGTPSGQIVHVIMRSPESGRWAATAACGHAGWRQGQLDAELMFALRLVGIHPSRRCARANCAALWPLYDARR